MTSRITLPDGRVVVVIEATDPVLCGYCGETKECRPYSEDGRPVCFECAMRPEHKEIAVSKMREMLR